MIDHCSVDTKTRTPRSRSKSPAARRTSQVARMAAQATTDMANEEKEAAHFESVLASFEGYLRFSLASNNLRRRSYNVLPRSQRALLNSLGPSLPLPDGVESSSTAVAQQGFKARLDEIDDRIRRNAAFLEDVLSGARGLMGVEDVESSTGSSNSNGKDSTHTHAHTQNEKPKDVEKVRSTLKQLIRDWSSSGSTERTHAYGPILNAIESLYSSIPIPSRASIKILTPGCGLGRLPWEIAMRGYSSQGNEFSFFMLIVSNYILNRTTSINQHTIYPWIHNISNWKSSKQLLQGECIPDVNPNDLTIRFDSSRDQIQPPDFSMLAGDFIQIYSNEEHKAAWNSIVTCFFLDTAHNPIDYLSVINHVLPIGGYWLNLGPLLWHFEGQGPADNGKQQGSIELTLEEVLHLVHKMGFNIVQRKTLPRQSYTGNAGNMLTYEYMCEFWVAEKVRDVGF